MRLTKRNIRNKRNKRHTKTQKGGGLFDGGFLNSLTSKFNETRSNLFSSMSSKFYESKDTMFSNFYSVKNSLKMKTCGCTGGRKKNKTRKRS